MLRFRGFHRFLEIASLPTTPPIFVPAETETQIGEESDPLCQGGVQPPARLPSCLGAASCPWVPVTGAQLGAGPVRFPPASRSAAATVDPAC